MITGIVAGQYRTAVASVYKYWRITVTASGSIDTYKAHIAEAELFNGTSSVSMVGTYTASSSFSGLGPDKAFDGSAATFWSTNSSTLLPQWIMANLTTAASATSIKITSADNTERALRSPLAFTVEASNNGSMFDTIASFSGIPAWGVSETREFTF